MRTSEEITEIAVALVKTQAALKPAAKDATNPHFRTRYADLSAVWDACRAPLHAAGLVALQDVTSDERGVSIVTRVQHVSGQWMEFGPLLIPLSKQDAQGVGSATSYGKRYALAAALGIVAEEDDDGHDAASKAPTPSTAAPSRPSTSRPAQTSTPHTNGTGGLRVMKVETKDGQTNGKAWRSYRVTFSDGTKASTFSRDIGDAAISARDSGVMVRPLTKPGKYGLDLESLDVVRDVTEALDEPEGFMDAADDADVPF